MSTRNTELRLSVIARLLVDAAVVFSSMTALIVARELIAAWRESADSTGSGSMLGTMAGVVILVSISLNVFFLAGFYRQNRHLNTKSKIKAIAQAVIFSHLMFGFILLMMRDVLEFSRSVLVLDIVISAMLLSIIRLNANRIGFVQRFLDRLDNLDYDEPPLERILVVGGAGYIGSALVRKLLDRGRQVRLLDALMFGEEPIADLLDHPNLELQQGDFRQVDAIVKAMAGVDAVVHLGAIVGDPACELDPDLTLDTNLLATRVLADVAQAAGVRRFIFASTCSVYGAGDEILNERSELNPVSLYAKTKIACEEVLLSMVTETFSPVILRFGTIYGLSGRTRFDLVVNLLTAKAEVEGRITVFGGAQWRPFVHVDDAAASVLAALEAPREVVHSEVFNVGSNEQNRTIDDVAEMIHEKIPTAEVVQMGSDGDRRDYRVDFTKIGEALDFEPAWTIEMGIDEVIDSIRSGRVSDYNDPKYSNLKSLQNRPVIDLTDSSQDMVIMRYGVAFDRVEGSWTRSLVSARPSTKKPVTVNAPATTNGPTGPS